MKKEEFQDTCIEMIWGISTAWRECKLIRMPLLKCNHIVSKHAVCSPIVSIRPEHIRTGSSIDSSFLTAAKLRSSTAKQISSHSQFRTMMGRKVGKTSVEFDRQSTSVLIFRKLVPFWNSPDSSCMGDREIRTNGYLTSAERLPRECSGNAGFEHENAS